MLSAVEGVAGLYPGSVLMHIEQIMVVPVARFAPVTATAVSCGVLVCKAVCAVLLDKQCTQPLLCDKPYEPQRHLSTLADWLEPRTWEIAAWSADKPRFLVGGSKALQKYTFA